VVELLLGADPAAVCDEDRDGVCPLSLVWEGYANGFGGKRDLKALLRKFEGEGEQQLQQQQGEELNTAEKRVKEALTKDTPALRQLQSKWRIVNNLLRAYFHFPIQSLDAEITEEECGTFKSGDENGKRRKWRILHAVSAIKCHHTLFLLARALHPEQATELDENDLLGVNHDTNHLPQSPLGEKQTISNRTALHFAAMSPLSGKDGRNVIKTLLFLNPQAARHADGYGSLPLHLMAENEHKVHWVQDGFRDVYNANEGASSYRDGLGRTPLHCATSCSGRYSTASHSQPAPPEEATTPPPPNVLPPNNAARNIGSVILNLVIVNPSAATISDNTGRLPLHYIAEHGEAWTNDAQSILSAHPAASRARAGAVAYHQLPLHMAASNPDACPSLIENIVNANPRAASLTDGTGRLPLFMACDSGRTTWDRGMESIYNAYPAAISAVEESSRRWTVLHTAAASHSAGCDLIENVLQLNPGAASVADGEGRYPLHLACAAGRHWEEGGLRMLFEADPSVALIEDRKGYLPLHIVAMKKPSCLVEDGSREDGMEEEGSRGGERMEGNEEEDLALLEVLFNLLIAQPSTVQLR
jgi:ankyrin repeat protein